MNRQRESGVALAIVVWFIAGMSLLVAGIVSHARVDTGMTQIHLGRAKAVAAGDGAIMLAMLGRSNARGASAAGPMIAESSHTLGDLAVTVRLYPGAGFVDLNVAPAETMTALFAYAAQLPRGEAKLIADNVVKWRSSPAAGSRRALQRQRFYALEDLLRVDGVNRGLLDGIRDYAVAGDWSQGGIDWSAAPESAMTMLEELSPGQVDSIMRRRDNLATAQRGGGTRGGTSGGGLYRADALVSYGGRTWLRRLWITSQRAPGSRLPWRVVRTEPPRVVGG